MSLIIFLLACSSASIQLNDVDTASEVVDSTAGVDQIDSDHDGFVFGDDCDDDNASVYPGAEEVCNGFDDNCDGQVDNAATDATLYYLDLDADGFGDAGAMVTSCEEVAGYVVDNTDCDDTSSVINPNAMEICDGLDDDCDGGVDEGFDSDGDGYTTCAGDCNDADNGMYPGAEDCLADDGVTPQAGCNGIDDDCDGKKDG